MRVPEISGTLFFLIKNDDDVNNIVFFCKLAF